MTFKLSPRTILEHARGYLWLHVCLFALCGSGCSSLSARRGSLTDYEQARRTIENPSGFEDEEYAEGVFRPEGLSAERAGRKSHILDRIGFSSKRRKDVELARKHYRTADETFARAREAEEAERSELFRRAADEYQQAAKNWRSSGLEQDALLMAAESRFFAEDYYRAEQLYAQLIKEYPRTKYLDHVDSRRFEIADYWLKAHAAAPKPFVMVNFTDGKYPWNDTGGHGTSVLERMRLDNPTGKVSDDATMRLAVEKYTKGKYESAADTFADLRMTYPDSEHQFNAQFLELQSLLASYQGADYSSVPLTDAQTRVKQIVKQFPAEASDRQQELNQAYAKIRFLMAERIWTQSDYRRKRQEYGSARYHYERILDEYADTPFADKAREALEELKGEPDDPPQRFKALVWIFGDTTGERPWQNRDTTSE